jgi:cell division protein FtsQ
MFARVEKQKKQVKLLGEILLWIGIAVIVAIIAENVEKFRNTSPYFTVRNVILTIDSQKIDNLDEAFVYLNLKKGTSIFGISPQKLVKDIISRHPEVREAKVKKRLPDTLQVEVKNRIAVAQVRLTKFYPLDDEGFLLPYPVNFRLPDLPCLKGINSSEVIIGDENNNHKLKLGLKIVHLMRRYFPDIYKNIDIDVSDERNIILYLPQGPKVKLAEYKLEEKISKLKLVLRDINQKNITPEFIDLRFDKAILIPRQR